MRELVGRRRKKKVGGEQLEQEARRNGFSRPFNTMRFIGEMRLTIITTDEFSLVPLFRRKTRRWRGGEARFNLTGEDVPLDKCPRTIHLQRNSWPFFSFSFFFPSLRTPRDRPYSKGSPFGIRALYLLSSLLVFCPPNTRRYRVYFHQRRGFLWAASSSCNLTGRASRLVVETHVASCDVIIEPRSREIRPFQGGGESCLGCRV